MRRGAYFLRPLAAAMVKLAREAMESAAARATSNSRAAGPKGNDPAARPWPGGGVREPLCR